MQTVEIEEAIRSFTKLLADIEAGDQVIVARDGTPVAELKLIARIERIPGEFADHPALTGWTYDPLVFKPLATNEELAAEGWPV